MFCVVGSPWELASMQKMKGWNKKGHRKYALWLWGLTETLEEALDFGTPVDSH